MVKKSWVYAALVVYFLTFFWMTPAQADILHLKNGQQIEGIIEDEGEDQVILDVGFGTVALKRTEILKIEHSDAKGKEAIVQQQQSEYFETGRWVPKGAEELFQRFKEIRSDRDGAFRAKTKKEDLIKKQTKLESEIASLKQKYSPLAEELKTVYPKKATYRHNKLVKEINVLTATIQVHYAESETLGKQITEADGKIHRYLNTYRDFKEYARGKIQEFRREQAEEKDRTFYDGIERSLKEMDEDFLQETVTSRHEGSNLIVNVTLNDKVTASLIVDTGASLTVLSRDVAKKLGIGPKATLGEIDAAVADGRVVKAQAVLLDSIAVGKARVERSMAAVLPTSESKADGLLGMSFLKHFVVQVDAKNDLLILERLK